jgi:hypothetical protein
MNVQIPKECTKNHRGKEIVCAEKGRKMIFLNPNQRVVGKHIIDGCQRLRAFLSDANCKLCDFLVVDWRSEEHYVELKGSNVEHALRQLESTILQLGSAKTNSRVYCWIITTESPSTQSKFQVLKEKFENQFKARLTIRTNQHQHSLETLER